MMIYDISGRIMFAGMNLSIRRIYYSGHQTDQTKSKRSRTKEAEA